MDFLLGFFTFPLAVFSVPFLFLFVIMLLSVFTGFIDDLPFGDADTDIDIDAEVSAGTWLPVGITKVPLTVSLTTVTFVGTVILYYINYFLFEGIQGTDFYLFSALAIILTFIISLYVSAFLLKPLMPLFDKEKSFARINYVGMNAIVRSEKVSAEFGEAIVTKGSIENQLDIYTESSEPISYGDEVLIVSLDPAINRYLVIKK
jgi:uncharacterized membrane protein